MVFVNVPKLHALVGVLAATVAIPLGCSSDDFEGCEASRTCKPSGTGGSSGSSGTNGGGEAGDTGTGGTSGNSGASGADDGGHGGAADDTTRPTIVSITPDDGATEVERDVEITVTLSEPIDPASVTRRSATLEGPDGAVTGTLSVDGDVITFVAEKPLYLLGDYTFTLADTVADLAGNTLAGAASVGFQVRDGRWGSITTPFGRAPRHLGAYARNRAGDMVIGGGQPAELSSTIWAAVYNASEGTWTPAETLPLGQEVMLPSSYRGIGIDDERRMAAVWLSSTGAGWYRRSEANGWEDSGALPRYPAVAVTSDGRATAIWNLNGSLSSQTLEIDSGTAGPVTPMWSSVATLTDVQPVASLTRVAVFERIPDVAGHQITVAWRDPATGWAAREPIASADDISGIWLAEGDEEGNLVVIWLQGEQIWSRIYERETDSWTRTLLIATGSGGATFGFPRMTAGNVAVPLYLGTTAYSAYYQRAVGWVQNSIMDLAELGVGNFADGFGVETCVDVRGNMLAIGHEGYQRYVPGEGWHPAVEHGLDLGPYRMWTAPAPDGSILAITHDLTSTDEYVPEVVHFE